MSEDRVIKIGDHNYVMEFPTLGRVKKLGQLLKCDVLRNGIDKVNYAELFEDDARLNDVLACVFGDKIKPEAMLMDMTAGDIGFVLLAFFLKANQISATTTNGLNDFAGSINKAMAQKLQVVIPSTLPSLE